MSNPLTTFIEPCETPHTSEIVIQCLAHIKLECVGSVDSRNCREDYKDDIIKPKHPSHQCKAYYPSTAQRKNNFTPLPTLTNYTILTPLINPLQPPSGEGDGFRSSNKWDSFL